MGSGVTLALSLIVLIGYLELPGVTHARRMRSVWKSTPMRPPERRSRSTRRPARNRGGNPGDPNDWVARMPWIKAFNIDYFMGVDGISFPLVVLTTVLCLLAMVASWPIKKYVKATACCSCCSKPACSACSVALDFFLFYVFWEVMLLPMYFLIGIWGGPRKEYAAIKFFLYTLLGSVLMLIAILALLHRRPRFREPRLGRTSRRSNGRVGVGNEEAARRCRPQTLPRRATEVTAST